VQWELNVNLKNLHMEVLNSFRLTAELSSFTEAAKCLCMSQSAVSKQIKSLEDSLGVKLFDRFHHRLALTAAGALLLEKIEAPMKAIEGALNSAALTESRRVIRVLAPITLVGRNLVPQLKEFNSRFPDVSIELVSSLASGADQEGIGEDWDFILAYLKHPGDHIQFRRIRMERHVAVSSPSLWLNGCPPSIYSSTLLHLAYDARNPSQAWANWHGSIGANIGEFAPRGMYFQTLEQVIGAAITGAGIALVDEAMISRELSSGELVKVCDEHIDGPYGYWLADLRMRSMTSDLTHLLFRTMLERAAGAL
jgi:LysR family glycine cleavage system transcriptional activator